MQDSATVEDVSSISKRILINVSSETVDEKSMDFFNSIKDQVEVAGFRKGKAPVSIIKKRFFDKSKKPVANILLSEFYTKAIQEGEITPVGNPIIENLRNDDEYPGAFGINNSYSVSVVIDVLPTIAVTGHSGMELVFPENDESDDMFESIMSSHQEQFAQKTDVSDRAAQNGDMIIFDFKGSIDGDIFEGGSAEGFTLEKLGAGQFISGFEEQMVGMLPSEERIVTVTFPEDYNAEHLAGKEAQFDTKLLKIIDSKKADVDADLAMMVGHESVDELIASVRDQANSVNERKSRAIIEAQIGKKLISENEFDVPQSMLESELQRLLGAGSGQQITEDVVNSLRQAAEFNVKRALILDAVYESEDELEVTPDELDELLEEHAKDNDKTKDEIVSMLYNSGQMDAFMGVLRSKKAIDYIVDNASDVAKEEKGE